MKSDTRWGITETFLINLYELDVQPPQIKTRHFVSPAQLSAFTKLTTLQPMTFDLCFTNVAFFSTLQTTGEKLRIAHKGAIYK